MEQVKVLTYKDERLEVIHEDGGHEIKDGPSAIELALPNHGVLLSLNLEEGAPPNITALEMDEDGDVTGEILGEMTIT